MHHLSLGNLLLRAGKAREAETAYRRAIALAPRRPEGFFALSQLLLRERSTSMQALELARKTVKIAPSAPGFYVLARAYAANDRLPEARTAIERACSLAPNNAQFLKLRAQLQPPPTTSTP